MTDILCYFGTTVNVIMNGKNKKDVFEASKGTGDDNRGKFIATLPAMQKLRGLYNGPAVYAGGASRGRKENRF